MPKKTVEQEIHAFMDEWDMEHIDDLGTYLQPLQELYSITEEKDWIRDAVGAENSAQVLLVRMIYIISRMADRFGGRFAIINSKFKGLWRRMENVNMVEVTHDE